MAHPLAPQAAPLSLESLFALGLSLSAALYVAGWRRLRRRGRGRARPAAWRAGCYAGGVAALALAVVSPIATAGERFFSAHMVQHLLLAVVAPPLLWLGAPTVPLLWGLPGRLRRPIGRLLAARRPIGRALRLLARPAVASLLYLATLAFWHVPVFYDAAQGPALVHHLEHVLLLGTALAYFWPVIHPTGGSRPLGYGATLLYLVPPMVEGDVIGALISFAQVPLYATYAAIAGADLDAVVADQRAGGLVMWVGGGLFWLVPMSVVFFLASRDARPRAGAPVAPLPVSPSQAPPRGAR
ncbi:MAG TPA: cytochrome c oxidase assembly protein [Thermodesulfobacteriota bacterium]